MEKVSKNSRAGRRKPKPKRMYQGKEVRTVKYVGHWAGHGTYIAGTIDDYVSFPELIRDKNGKPLPYSAIGRIEYVS